MKVAWGLTAHTRPALVGVLLLLSLVMLHCAPPVVRTPTAAEDATRDISPPPAATNGALTKLALSDDRTDAWLGMSALVGWYRAAGQSERSESVLKQRIDRLSDEAILPLYLLWYGDEALFTGRTTTAIERYTQALAAAGERALVGRLLRSEVLAQRATARALEGDGPGAEADLMGAARGADHMRAASMVRRAADIAWASGNRKRAAALRLKADKIIEDLIEGRPLSTDEVMRRGDRHLQRAEGWRVPPIGGLGLKAPWEAGVAQRAGGIGPGFGAWAGYIGRAFTRGHKSDPCGAGLTGYYYDRGSHRSGWYAGRDLYAIDFTRGRHSGSRVGNDSFGVQVRAAASGIVTHSYYGTRTFWNGWDPGPSPEANRVNILHPLGGAGLLRQTLDDLDEAYAIYPLRGLQSWSLHMVGLQEPCDRDGGLCIEHPALVSFGMHVWQGSPLGYEDSTGMSAMSHLHYSLMVPCSARDPRCAAEDPRLTHVSVPIALEGEPLGVDDTGACVRSTNSFSLSEGAAGLPAVVKAVRAGEAAVDAPSGQR